MAFFLAYILAFYVAFYVAYILAVYLAYILAVFLAYILAFHLAAEVQRCPLSSEGPRLRSSSAHCARKMAKRLAKSWQGGSGRGSGGRGGGGEGGRGEGGGEGGGAGTAVIKSNNPHLAGGEITIFIVNLLRSNRKYQTNALTMPHCTQPLCTRWRSASSSPSYASGNATSWHQFNSTWLEKWAKIPIGRAPIGFCWFIPMSPMFITTRRYILCWMGFVTKLQLDSPFLYCQIGQHSMTCDF